MHVTKRHAAIVATLASTLFILPIARAWAQDDETSYQPVTSFDPQRNPYADLQQAVAEAERTHRRILLDVGGQWCEWCKYMDQFFDSHPDLKELRDRNYIWLKINFSQENQNKQFLSQYPSIPAYPHLFVLTTEGHLVRSQATTPLEEAKSYSADRMKEFLNRWAAPQEIDSPLSKVRRPSESPR